MTSQKRGGRRLLRKEKRKRTRMYIFSRVLIFIGLSLMLVAVLYEALNYPWKTLFQSEEELNEDTLPMPTMPPENEVELVPFDFDSLEQNSLPLPEELPGQNDTLGNFGAAPSKKVQITVLGAVKIPKLNLSVNLIDGTSQDELLYGAGYVRGTSLPGRPGNCSIAGHRVTARMHPFRHMNLMKPGDLVYVHFGEHVYIYETYETFIVHWTESWVMKNVENEKYCLTLITCHPPGSARERYILRGRLKSIDGQDPDAFYAAQAAAAASQPPVETPPVDEQAPDTSPESAPPTDPSPVPDAPAPSEDGAVSTLEPSPEPPVDSPEVPVPPDDGVPAPEG